MYKYYNKKNIIIKLFIILIINIILIGSAIFIYLKVDYLNTELDREIENIDSNSLNVKKLRDNLSFIKQISKETENYDGYLFLFGNELDLITDLEEIASNNDVSLTIKGLDLDKQSVGLIKMEILTSGTYINIFKYLEDLENYYYFIVINSLEMTPSKYANYDSSSSFLVNMKLNISIYAH